MPVPVNGVRLHSLIKAGITVTVAITPNLPRLRMWAQILGVIATVTVIPGFVIRGIGCLAAGGSSGGLLTCLKTPFMGSCGCQNCGASMRIIIAAIAAFTVAGCTSSGIARIGPDTYTVTNTAITSFGGAASAKGGAYTAAESKCAETGKKAVVIENKTQATIASGSADVTFRCE